MLHPQIILRSRRQYTAMRRPLTASLLLAITTITTITAITITLLLGIAPQQAQADPGGYICIPGPSGACTAPSRFTVPDRGEKIRYYVDAEETPPGIDLPMAMTALKNALKAWEDNSSLEFEFAGFKLLQAEADGFSSNAFFNLKESGVIYIQFHNKYGPPPRDNTIGNGGMWTSWDNQKFNDGGQGGELHGQKFHETGTGWLVIEHKGGPSSPALEGNAILFEAVLCHEIGHALGLDHSSEDQDEDDPFFKESIMYATTSPLNQGAVLSAYDIDRIQKIYPKVNQPPAAFTMFVDGIASPNNTCQSHSFASFDRNGDALVSETAFEFHQMVSEPAVPIANFSINNTNFTWCPNFYFSDSTTDPNDFAAFGGFHYRLNDGEHYSGWKRVLVKNIYQDSDRPSDGLPDSWVAANFGSGTAVASEDSDNDGWPNIAEFAYQTSPNDPNSVVRFTDARADRIKWIGPAYRVFDIDVTPDLLNPQWTRLQSMTSPTADPEFRVNGGASGSTRLGAIRVRPRIFSLQP